MKNTLNCEKKKTKRPFDWNQNLVAFEFEDIQIWKSLKFEQHINKF